MKLAKARKTPDWTPENLTKVLKSLKSNKARDPHGMIAEIFKPKIAGEDLFKSLLLFLNGIKSNQTSFDFLEFANITSLYKAIIHRMFVRQGICCIPK